MFVSPLTGRLVPKIILSKSEPFMGNLQRKEKCPYLDGLRRESTLFEDFVEPCKTRKINGAWKLMHIIYNLSAMTD